MQEIRQWRPITLLATAYKALSKMINARVWPDLPSLIDDMLKDDSVGTTECAL